MCLLVAACGGDDEDGGVASLDDAAPPSTGVAAEDTSDEAKVLEFAACMRDGGIDFPDPIVDADGNVSFDLGALRDLGDLDQDDVDAAFEPCAPLLEGVSFGFERIFEPDFQDDVLAFAACMRDNGFDMPDPDFAALPTTGRLFDEPLDLNDPDFEPAFDACQEVLPGLPGISGD